ncbi:MAG TPA: hypothetical protein VFR70_04985 [Flavobacterium sp.]|nr:hypothetical protein [Flavobacterium sp.]
MKKILLLVTIHFCHVSKGQEKYTYEFEKLGITDTIHDQGMLKSLKRDSGFNYNDYFFAERHFEGEAKTTCYLVKKNQNYWISYALPYDKDINTMHLIGPSENKNYFFATSYSSHLSHGAGRVDENAVENLIIVDIQNISYIQLDSYAKDTSVEIEENGDEKYIENVMVSNFILQNDCLTILTTCLDNGNNKTCANPGGLYEFNNQKLRKIKNYNPANKGFSKINYAGKIAIGMTVEDIRLTYPNARFFKTDNPYTTCADAETAIEVWDGGHLLGHALTKQIHADTTGQTDGENINYSNEKTYEFMVLSPSINFGRINKNTTAGEIIKLYPDANIRIDSLTDWEHVFIKELNIELVFKTGETNRISAYKNENFAKLKNKKATPDFIIASN